MPALSKAREQARYVRWQASSRDLSMDPDIVLHWNLQNDRGGVAITNMAVQNQYFPSYNASALDGVLMNTQSATWFMPETNTAALTNMWHFDGRFRGKPALYFDGTYNPSGSGNTALFIADPKQSAMMGKMLKKTQAITIVAWICITPQMNQTFAGTKFLWWSPFGGSTSRPAIDITCPNQGNAVVGWETGNSTVAPDGIYPAFTYGTDSNWMMWAFTKDSRAGLMKAYLNGVLIAANTGMTKLWIDFESRYPKKAAATSRNFCVGQFPGNAVWVGMFDELSIFNADLDPGNQTIGSIGPRFMDMYNMGAP